MILEYSIACLQYHAALASAPESCAAQLISVGKCCGGVLLSLERRALKLKRQRRSNFLFLRIVSAQNRWPLLRTML
jgi:hypothetical protein